MSAPQHCIGHISTPYGDAAILVGRYPSGGAIAIQLVDVHVQLGEAKNFLKENTVCSIMFYNGKAIGVTRSSRICQSVRAVAGTGSLRPLRSSKARSSLSRVWNTAAEARIASSP